MLRLPSGKLADRTGRLWPLSIAGYAMTVIAVPLLALAQLFWQAAALMEPWAVADGLAAAFAGFAGPTTGRCARIERQCPAVSNDQVARLVWLVAAGQGLDSGGVACPVHPAID